MNNNIKESKKYGPFGKALLLFSINSYYPKSITELVQDENEIEYEGCLFKGVALVKLNSCIYNAKSETTGILTDLESELEVEIKEPMPHNTHITNVLLTYKPNKMPILEKYTKTL